MNETDKQQKSDIGCGNLFDPRIIFSKNITQNLTHVTKRFAITVLENQQVKKMILENHRITTKEFADDIGKSFGSYQTFWT